MTRIALTVNGKAVAAEVAPRTHLADFLREHLLLTGTHIGCEHGICGACTVEIDGEIAADPLGPISFANCPCGTTLTVGSRGMPPSQMVEMLKWAKEESVSRSIGIRDLLLHIRDRIDELTLKGENDA